MYVHCKLIHNTVTVNKVLLSIILCKDKDRSEIGAANSRLLTSTVSAFFVRHTGTSTRVPVK